MKKARIVERTSPQGEKTYVIQQRHFVFRWIWVDSWVNSWSGAATQDTFSTLEQAEKALPMFDGTPWKERVIRGAE